MNGGRRGQRPRSLLLCFLTLTWRHLLPQELREKYVDGGATEVAITEVDVFHRRFVCSEALAAEHVTMRGIKCDPCLLEGLSSPEAPERVPLFGCPASRVRQGAHGGSSLSRKFIMRSNQCIPCLIPSWRHDLHILVVHLLLICSHSEPALASALSTH